jgi:hypothetical protein
MADRVANQSCIIVVKDEQCAEGEHYAFIIQSQAEKAMKKLNTTGFALWFYIVQNNNGYKFNLSSKDFCNWSGLSRKTYSVYINKMKDMGFLVPINNNSNDYYFYADPDKIKLEREEDCIVHYDHQEYQNNIQELKTKLEPFNF